jgi:hypothetical protein
VCCCACECVRMRVCASACVFSLALGAFPSKWERWLSACRVSLPRLGGLRPSVSLALGAPCAQGAVVGSGVCANVSVFVRVRVRVCVCFCACECVHMRVCASARVFSLPCSGIVPFAMGVVVGSVQGLSPTLGGVTSIGLPCTGSTLCTGSGGGQQCVCVCVCECVRLQVCASASVLLPCSGSALYPRGAFPTQWERWLAAISVSLPHLGG